MKSFQNHTDGTSFHVLDTDDTLADHIGTPGDLAVIIGSTVTFYAAKGPRVPGKGFGVWGAGISAGAVPASRLITAGTGLSGGGDFSADRTLAVSLGTITATLGSDVALPAATLTTVLSITLPSTGTYDLKGTLTALAGAAAVTVDATIAVGTAAGTLAGGYSGSSRQIAAFYTAVPVSGLFTCTTAGTILLRANASTASTAKALTFAGYAGATGLTAVRIA